MAVGKAYIGAFRIYQDRDVAVVIDCHEEDGNGELVLESADAVEARLWITDGAAATIVVTESSTPSVVVVNDLGTPNTTPARVTIKFAADDTDDLTADAEYDFELSFKDNSDSNKHKVICRGTAIVEGSPST